jgi:hypothetical protein
METENTKESLQPQIELIVTGEAKGYINETRKWAKFLAILGFIGSGIIAIVAVFAGSMFSEIWGGASFMITILYLLMALLYFFPSLYLYRFSEKANKALYKKDSNELEDALGNLKSTFKFYGIAAIVVISLYLLFFIFAGLGAGLAGMMN